MKADRRASTSIGVYLSEPSAQGRIERDSEGSVSITLPYAPVIFLEIRNGYGGVARRTITISPDGMANIVSVPCDGSQLPNIPAHHGCFISPFLMMGSDVCPDASTCIKEAKLYYQAIGALDPITGNATNIATLDGWKQAFGFSPDATHPGMDEVQAVFYNNADLQFGRDMHCRTASFKTVACYVSNFDDGGMHRWGSDPQMAIKRAGHNNSPIGTVAMTYGFDDSSSQDYQVHFYAFRPTGELVSGVDLDDEGQKEVPGVCMACHGGAYNPNVHKVMKSSFLPFDAPSYIFSNKIANISERSQREMIRQLNQMIKPATYARPTISQLIDGWYRWCGGVGTSGCYIDDIGHPFYPSQQPCPPSGPGSQSDVSCGWPTTWGGADAQSFYQNVPRRYCRTCHIAQANYFNINSFTDWKEKAASGNIKSHVFCPNHFMPFAQVPYNAFWRDFQAQDALTAFIKAQCPPPP